MAKSKNIFVCIGAIHYDYLLNLKNKIVNFRTNPILHQSRIGGVAYNIAKIISVFEKIQFYSLKIEKELKNSISKNISIKEINKKISNRYYIAISDKNNKFLLGLANTDVYESIKNFNIPIIKNKYVIFDLNFSKTHIENTIKALSNHNKIIVCATSIQKIEKINRVIKYIDIIFCNKGELLKLTKTNNIYLGVKKIQKINSHIKIIATNSNNNVIYGHNNYILKITPPKIKLKNENGAGDALAAMMLYLKSKGYDEKTTLKYAIACGSYYASGKKINIKSDLIKIKKLSKKVIIS